jgi:hypothetical protein
LSLDSWRCCCLAGSRYFAWLGALLAAGPVDPAALTGLAGRFGRQLDLASLPGLLSRGLRLPQA